ncbi:MAG: hypothetical protein IJ627_03395 [Bacteroidales bacterium]|nr:hypothetical protein [Bacteroidales bacterium]
MEKQTYAKICKIILWVLMIVSVGFYLLGLWKGFPGTHDPDNGSVAPILNWGYIVICLALLSIFGVGLVVRAKTDPKSLVKIGIIVVALAAIVGIAYAIAPGTPAIGLAPSAAKDPSNFDPTMLKWTDTILSLTYVTVGLSILSLVVSEIVLAIRNKK